MPGPPPCHYRPFIFCIVGRGLDPLAGRRGRRHLHPSPENLPPTAGEGFIPPAPLPSSLTPPSHHLPKSHRKGAHRHAIHQHYPPLDTRQPADHGAGARAGGGTVPVLQLQRPLRRCRARGGKSFFHRRGPPAGHGHGGGHRNHRRKPRQCPAARRRAVRREGQV